MSDLRKAAEMALEALENYKQGNSEPAKALRQALSNEFNPDWNQVEALQESLREHMAEIQRLRQALAQPNSTCNGMPAYEGSLSKSQALAQPEQEPAAWEHFYTPDSPFYTAPPKREWVGLTDEEIKEYKWMGQDVIAVIKEVQATLKEKNT